MLRTVAVGLACVVISGCAAHSGVALKSDVATCLPYSVAVHVADSSGVVVQASVVVIGTRLGEHTNDRGWAVVTNLPRGPVRVRVFTPGWNPLMLEAESDSCKRDTLEARLNRTGVWTF